LTNAGTFTETTPGSALIDIPFDNVTFGQVRVETGHLGFLRTGTDSGHFAVEPGASLGLVNPGPFFDRHNLNAGGSLSGQFANVADGEELASADGSDSFVAHDGSNSSFASDSVVLEFVDTLPGDMSGDGEFNNLDINPFVSMLTEGSSLRAVPEPGSVALLGLGVLSSWGRRSDARS